MDDSAQQTLRERFYRTHDVMGQIEYNLILPFPHLGDKDRVPLGATVWNSDWLQCGGFNRWCNGACQQVISGILTDRRVISIHPSI